MVLQFHLKEFYIYCIIFWTLTCIIFWLQTGLNIILISRTPYKLQNVAAEIEEKYPGVKTKIIEVDFAKEDSTSYIPKIEESIKAQWPIFIIFALVQCPRKVWKFGGSRGYCFLLFLLKFLITWCKIAVRTHKLYKNWPLLFTRIWILEYWWTMLEWVMNILKNSSN